MADAPKFDNAPGLKVRPRRNGTFTAFWQARTDLVRRGYRPQVIPIWNGIEPDDADRALVSDICENAQSEMLVWGRGGFPSESLYNGTMRSLIHCYKTDPDSRYRKLRHGSRENYNHFLRRIDEDHGDDLIQEIRPRDLMRWHEEWSERGVTMAHSLMGHVRGLLTFGMTMLECPDCAALSVKASKLKFQMARPRTSILTAEMAAALCAKAHEEGLPSVALAQAIQFVGMLRQRDVIGEWVPIAEAGTSEIVDDGSKWLRGIRWEEIDANLVLRHVTSKRQKEVEIRLGADPFFLEQLALCGGQKDKGPVIVSERTGQPWGAMAFRHTWRKLADAAGIPKDVHNRDTRAGAITEATQAGADLESIKHAAAHSDISQTQQYARASADKSAKVLQMRVAHRNKPGT